MPTPPSVVGCTPPRRRTPRTARGCGADPQYPASVCSQPKVPGKSREQAVVVGCPGRDSNPHSPFGQRLLRPRTLPVCLPGRADRSPCSRLAARRALPRTGSDTRPGSAGGHREQSPIRADHLRGKAHQRLPAVWQGGSQGVALRRKESRPDAVAAPRIRRLRAADPPCLRADDRDVELRRAAREHQP